MWAGNAGGLGFREQPRGGFLRPLTLSRGFVFNINVNEPEPILEPLAYHFELRDYLKSQEREVWNWFSSAQAKADYTENVRLELLKSTYRLDADGQPELYQSLNEVKARLYLDIPVTLYQAQTNQQLNAALYYIPGQGHIVFSGPVFTLLNGEELKSVIGHELAHYHLWERDAGEFHIIDRLIHAVAGDPRASASHEQTARRYQLYTEIFADRGSLRAIGDARPVVAGLVKMQTGLPQVSAASYLKQAEEIFANGDVSTEGVSHPEAFIRARALALWQERGEKAAAPIRSMIEGRAKLDELDLIGQIRLTSVTERLLQCLLRPKWFQTPAALGHAKLFFDNFTPANGNDSPPVDELKFSDPKLREYLCFLLLDFTKADPELDEMPLAAALELSRQLDLDAQFEKLAAKELKMRIRDLRRIKEQAAEMLTKMEANGD
jgi:predicted SprT family Zn-dependent metalloprotease